MEILGSSAKGKVPSGMLCLWEVYINMVITRISTVNIGHAGELGATKERETRETTFIFDKKRQAKMYPCRKIFGLGINTCLSTETLDLLWTNVYLR